LSHSSSYKSREADTLYWMAAGRLVFAHCYGATQLIHSQVKAPLKVQRPFYPEGPGICHSVILHTAGGVVGRDRLSLPPETQCNRLSTTAARFIAVIGYKQDKAFRCVDADACLELPKKQLCLMVQFTGKTE